MHEIHEELVEDHEINEMLMSSVNYSLCLKKELITEFHDNIITASYGAMQKHIPYSHKSKSKVIPGWDIEMDIARDESIFCTTYGWMW